MGYGCVCVGISVCVCLRAWVQAYMCVCVCVCVCKRQSEGGWIGVVYSYLSILEVRHIKMSLLAIKSMQKDRNGRTGLGDLT